MNKKNKMFINNIIEKNNKKSYHEEIFMPKFFLNLLNLSKKAEKSGRNPINLINKELILDSKTFYKNIPSLNIRNIKNSNNINKESENKNLYTKIKYISSINSPGRMIIRPSLPKLNYKTNTISYSNNINNNNTDIKNENTVINKKIIIKGEDYNNAFTSLFPIQVYSSPSYINKNNSYSFININRYNRQFLNRICFPEKFKYSNYKSQNKQINIKIEELYHFNKRREKKYFNRNRVNRYLNLFMNNKANQDYSQKNIINNKSTKKTKNNEKDYVIDYYSMKELAIKTNNSFHKKNSKIKNLYPLQTITEFSVNFRTKESITYLFLNKKMINYSINSNITLNSQPQVFYYYVNKMYRNQIMDYMMHRINWKCLDYNNAYKINPRINEDQKININFEWKYFSNRLNYKNYRYDSNVPTKKLRMINLFEKNYEIGNKKNMFLNLISYCDKIKYNIFEIVPFTLIISYKKDLVFAMKALKDLIEFIEKNKYNKEDIISDRKYNEHFWYDKNYEKINNQIIYINKNFFSEKNYWIIKPTDLYQGKYIEICNTFNDIYKICINMFKGVNENLVKEEDDDDDDNENQNNTNLNKQKNNIIKKSIYSKMYCCNDIIIQKYLDNPLLYKKRKFDIRCFVLLDNNLNLFYCREGHLKGSSELYNVKNSNKFIHITNYSFQKKSSKFEKYEVGNEISYKDFKLFLKEENIPLEKFDSMIEQIKFLIKVSFKSVNKKLYKINNVLCFELFGYDFIIDNDFKPWILEINNNPGLCISSPVIKKIIPRMMDDAFRLTIDKVFETKYSEECIDNNGNYKSKFPIEGYTDSENIFEFLCNIK